MDDYSLHVDGDNDSNLVSIPDRRKLVQFRGAVDSVNPAELEWLLLAHVLDRTAVIIYFIVISVMMAACF